MSTAKTRIVQLADDPALQAVLPLFTEMHSEMATQGMQLRLVPNGASMWLEGIRHGFERFGRMVVAEADGTVVGFAHGAIKLSPEHLGGERVGYVAHLFVLPAHRRAGIARALATHLNAWFAEKNVRSVELQVVRDNGAGAAFWKSLGYKVELTQLRKW
jgi:ribosomal protein S18 acetylase RimI-like enzyme